MNETATTPTDLIESRRRIDDVDAQILDLFQQRMRIVEDVAAYKRATGKPIFDPAREQQRIDDMTAAADPEFAECVAPLWLMLMELSRSHQNQLLDGGDAAIEARYAPLDAHATAACQGVEGAYSQQAAKALLPHADIAFLPSWEEVCNRVIDGKARYGILPLENSTAGSVDKVYDLISQGNLFIVGSVRLGIHHDLLANPGSNIADIAEVFSHEQALRQSQNFIESLGGNVHATILANTALAAKAVADSERHDVAAISSPACAELYGLQTLAHNVQDRKDNFTRFVCVAADPQIAPGADRSSLLLVLPHQPGSLYRALARMAALGVNMVKLESRPIAGRDSEFMFYVDIEGTIEDGAVRTLISQLERICEQCLYLGSYAEVTA